MDKREALRAIAAEASRGELVFPTFMEVGSRIQQALDDPDTPLDVAARLIQAEPLLSARIVAVANSAAFNSSGRAITDVRLAVSRLGARTVRALSTAVIARQLAGKPSQPALRDLAARLWEHTANVGALANVIARRVTRQDPETAMFAGMVHEVGGFYLLSRIQQFPALKDQEVTDWMVEGQGEGEVEIGRAVLKALAVPEAAIAAVEAMWEGYLSFPPATLGDTLLLAEHLSPVHSPLHHLQKADAATASIDSALDMDIEEETLTGILRESAEELSSLTAALRF
jgi:HD-like signal output (HDOD) protein